MLAEETKKGREEDREPMVGSYMSNINHGVPSLFIPTCHMLPSHLVDAHMGVVGGCALVGMT